MLQRAVVCCSVQQRLASKPRVCCSMFQRVAVASRLGVKCVAACRSVLQRAAVRCSVQHSASHLDVTSLNLEVP